MKGNPTAIHEASHVVVGYCLRATEVRIDEVDKVLRRGRAHVEPIDRAIRDVLVGLAGRVGQLEVDPEASKKRDPWHADFVRDTEKVIRIIERLCTRNGQPLDQTRANRIYSEADAVVLKLIAHPNIWLAIEEVAAAFDRSEGTLAHQEIERIVERHGIDLKEINDIVENVRLALELD